jgi:hypothetical protein
MTPKQEEKGAKQQPRKRIGRLKTPQDVARFMAKCIKDAAKGEGMGTKYYNLVNMSSQLLKAIEVADLEKRIEKLERER